MLMKGLNVCLGLGLMIILACGGVSSTITDADSTSATLTSRSDTTPTKIATVVPEVENTSTPTTSSLMEGDTNPATASLVQNTPTPTTVPVVASIPLDIIAPTMESESIIKIEPVLKSVPTPTSMPTPTSVPTPTVVATYPTEVAATIDTGDKSVPTSHQSTSRRSKVPEFSNDPAPDFVSDTAAGTFSDVTSLALSKALTSAFESTPDGMGISAAMYTSGKIWSGAIGMSEPGVPMTTRTTMRLMSTSKTFLGALVLSQIEEGLYGLDDHISSLLKGHEGYKTLDATVIPDVTIRELLTMRSGIRGEHVDATKMDIFRIFAEPVWEPTDSLRLMTSLAVSSGTYKYSPIANSYLLALVAEEMGNTDLLTLYRTKILDHIDVEVGLLPMTQTPASLAKPFADRSLYGGSDGFGDITKISLYTSYGLDYHQVDGRISWAGAGIISTPEQIAQWGYELMSPKGSAVSSEVRKQLTESFVDEWISLTETRQKYGFHLVLTEHILSDGSVILSYGHPGGGSGFGSSFLYSPSLDVSISLIANTEINRHLGACEGPSERNTKRGLNPMGCIALDFFEAVIAGE